MTLAAPPVASVAGRPISLDRLDQRVADVRRGPRGRHLPPPGAVEDVRLQRWVVQELVTEEILVHEARAAGIIPEPDAETGGHDGEPRTLSAAELATLVERVTGEVRVSTREVRSYYVRNQDLYRRPSSRRVRHVLLPDEAAETVVTRLAHGEAMDALAAELSIDPGSRARGGDLGDVHRGEFSGPLEDAIFAAGVGSVVGPIRTEHGWHVARVEAITPAWVVPFAEARPAIGSELRAAARAEAFAAWLERRRATLAVIEPAFEHPAHPIHGLPSHRH